MHLTARMQNDFVEARKLDPEKVTPDDFARLITTTRLHAASMLTADLSEEHYDHVKAIETKRVERTRAKQVEI